MQSRVGAVRLKREYPIPLRYRLGAHHVATLVSFNLVPSEHFNCASRNSQKEADMTTQICFIRPCVFEDNDVPTER